EPNNEVPTQVVAQELVELRVAETSIGDERDLDLRRQRFGELQEELVLALVSQMPELRRLVGLPDQRSRTTMVRQEIESDPGMTVGRILRPVRGDDDLLASRDQPRHRSSKDQRQIDFVVAQQPIELLDAVLRALPANCGQRTSDGRDAPAVSKHGSDDRES